MASCMVSVLIPVLICECLTYACDHNDMAVLALSHHRQDGLDDVHVREEIDLEDLIHQTDRATALRQFLNGADNSYMPLSSADEEHARCAF